MTHPDILGAEAFGVDYGAMVSELVGYCAQCGERIFDDERYIRTEDGELCCDEVCLMHYIDAEVING